MSVSPAPLNTRRASFTDGLTLRFDERANSGRPILILHGGGGPQTVASLATGLDKAHALVPTHHGFAGEPRPQWFDSIDDLAFAYLDLLDLSQVWVQRRITGVEVKKHVNYTRVGMRTAMRVPAPGMLSTSNDPPRCAMRSRMECSPR